MFIICVADKSSYLKQYGPTSRSSLFRSDSIHGGPLQKLLAHIFVRGGGVCPFPSNPRFNTGFQNNFAHMFSLTSASVMQKVTFDKSKVKVTVEGQMFELTLSGA